MSPHLIMLNFKGLRKTSHLMSFSVIEVILPECLIDWAFFPRFRIYSCCCRSNSSILGQRKKNQRKAKAKKRAQERRHSESEFSGTEDVKCAEDPSETESNERASDSISEEKANYNGVFEIDM